MSHLRKEKNKFTQCQNFYLFAGRGRHKESKFTNLTAIKLIKGRERLKNVHSFNVEIMQKTLVKLPGPIVCEWPFTTRKTRFDFKRSAFFVIYRSKRVTKKVTRETLIFIIGVLQVVGRKNSIKRCFYCVEIFDCVWPGGRKSLYNYTCWLDRRCDCVGEAQSE